MKTYNRVLRTYKWTRAHMAHCKELLGELRNLLAALRAKPPRRGQTRWNWLRDRIDDGMLGSVSCYDLLVGV